MTFWQKLRALTIKHFRRQFPGLTRAIAIRFFDIDAESSRFIRSELLRTELARMQRVLNDLHFDQGIHVTRRQIHVEFEGIFLNTARSTRYYKVPTGQSGNQGKPLNEFLNSHNINLETIVDLGANFGEISLYFAQQYPNARILAVEASPENYTTLQENLATQFFETSNVVTLNKAISDKKGEVEITAGMGSENTILFNENFEKNYRGYERGIERVEADTLISVLKEQKIEKVDFLKIDIEGAEPLLYDSLETLLANIHSIYMEVSWRNDVDAYLRLLKMLFERSSCYDSQGTPISSFNEIEQRILKLEKKLGFDLWFINDQ